ncbi:MAG: muramoyltetrapeptide carboxypeptidase [Bryobacterales bacterium]|nr:muramoyltetrapeptide carboxypeptidase [Bryobacterales bacterium]
MRRREFFPTVAAMAAVPPPPKLIKAKPLQPGDTVGLITPSSYVSDPDELDFARRFCEFFKLKIKTGKNVGQRYGYLAGTARQRVDDLHAMFADPEVHGVFCVRGGYGSAQMLDKIDYDLIRRNPKIFLGYSDITALHIAIGRRAGLVTFHGPVSTSHLSTWSQESLQKALFETAPVGPQTNPSDSNPLQPRHTMRTVRGGTARGALVGGNLTLLSTTLGTPFEVETSGRILLMEDIGEDIYRIDRMFTQLRLAGKLQAAAGIVVGECKDCPPPGHDSAYSLGEVIDYQLGDLGIPVLYGLSFGHTADQVTLPLGVLASLDAGKQQLIVEESAVRAS